MSFLLLAFMALSRLKSIESLRYCGPGEWGKLLGLDRIPEARTLRVKVQTLSEDNQANSWSERSVNDLISIQRYIARDNPQTAKKCVAKLRQRARRAAETALAGRIVP